LNEEVVPTGVSAGPIRQMPAGVGITPRSRPRRPLQQIKAAQA